MTDFTKLLHPPVGWKVMGPGLPDFNPATQPIFTLDQSAQLVQDLWWATSPDGRFSLDIGWYDHVDAGSPEARPLPLGLFMVALTDCEVAKDWEDSIVARFESRDIAEIIIVTNLLVSRFGNKS